MRLLYFAWVRERIGRAQEEIDLPPAVRTVGDLLSWLPDRGEEYRYALASPNLVRAALDHVHATAETPIAGAREVALFPPMTGG